jgi:methyl-accepting chemotaxis protein
MRWTIGTRLACGFAFMVALIVAPAAATYWWVRDVRSSQSQVLDVAQPALAAAKAVREGLHQAQAGQLGYLVAGTEPFQAQRAEGWQRASSNLAALETLAHHWPEEKRQIVDRLKAQLGSVQSLHAAAKLNAADGPTQVQKLADATAPLGDRMLGELNEMLRIEAALEKTPQRVQLMSELTALRASLHGALVEMHSYLTTAQGRHMANFQQQWKDNETMLRTLAGKTGLMTREQAQRLRSFTSLRSKFQPMPDELFAARKAPPAKTASQQLLAAAAPSEAEAGVLLNHLIHTQERQAELGKSKLQSQTALLPALLVGGPGIAAIFGIYLGWRLTRRVTRPLRRTMKALEALAAGDLTSRIDAETNDEFGRMARAINTLATAQAQPAAVAETPLPQFNQRRLQAFIDADTSRRRPHARPTAAPTRDESLATAAGASSEMQRTFESFQSVLGQVTAVAAQLQATTRRVAECSQTLPAEMTAEPVLAAAGAHDSQFTEQLAAQTQRLAQSSDRLRTQAVQLTQLMGQLQAGLATAQHQQPAIDQTAGQATEQVHAPQSPLAGPKSHVGPKQLVTN